MTAPLLCQNAYITELDRFDDTMRHWTEVYGAGPWFVYDIAFPESTFRGQLDPTNVRIGLTMMGPGQVEIIAPLGDSGSTVFREWLAERGPAPAAGLFHHFRVDTQDFDAQSAALMAAGGREGLYSKAPAGRQIAYIDVVDVVGSYVEVLTRTPQMDAVMARMRELCESWDGTDPVRDYVDVVQEVTGNVAGYSRVPLG